MPVGRETMPIRLRINCGKTSSASSVSPWIDYSVFCHLNHANASFIDNSNMQDVNPIECTVHYSSFSFAPPS